MNKDELRKHAGVLQSVINRLKDERRNDYAKLKEKYLAAEKNLKNNPKICGGEAHIKGYMSGLIDGMVLLGEHKSQITD